jgi:putative transposase
MPSQPRDRAPGLHHVWVNATGNWPYFSDNVDRMSWIRLLVRTLERFEWTCVAFCQMSTHVHMVLCVPDLSLSEGMRYLNREYSKDFNALHRRAGQFVRRRYGSRRIADARDLVGVYAYVVLNPVSAGMCSRAEDWRWSSFATTVGLTDDFTFVDGSLVLAEFGGSRAALCEFVAGQAAARLSD